MTTRAVLATALEAPVVLVGLMATGKSTVGRALAAQFRCRLWDSDAMVEERTGLTIAEIWRAQGEPAFRSLETEMLGEALDAQPPGVIAAAGGVVLAEANRRTLRRARERGALVVWLRAAPALLAARVSPGDHRPLLADDPLGTLERMAVEREPLYREVAQLIVDVDGEAVGAVVAGITATLEREREKKTPETKQ